MEETLAFINNFPWQNWRHAEIDITCPSVTITDGQNNWLKLGNYYGRFCFYYLDARSRYYEYYGFDMDEAQAQIKGFFAGELSLARFEKPFLGGLFKKSYFVTNPFQYTVKLWRVLFINFDWLFFLSFPFAGLSICLVNRQTSVNGWLVVICLNVLFGALFFYYFNQLYKYRGQHLRISRGDSSFTFGNSPDEIVEYDKKDIAKIIYYRPKNHKSPNGIRVFDIVFNDNTQIRFTNALISEFILLYKFGDYWNIPLSTIEGNVMDLI